MALCKNGALYTWGKGDHYRLGHGSEDHVRYPKLVESLLGKRPVQVQVGPNNVLVLTDDRQVWAWGCNEYGQFGSANPALITGPSLILKDHLDLNGVSLGPAQLVAWTVCAEVEILEDKLPFVLDPLEETFVGLDQLLDHVWEGLDGRREWPPPRLEQECIAVSSLNLLKLQLHSVLQRKCKLQCLQQGTSVLMSIKTKVVELASNNNVLETIQKAAQGCLQVGWMVLLPTPEERARALSALLPSSSESSSLGKRFMTDLLVQSLMADGGLETALQAAIKIEDLDEELEDKPEDLMTEQAQMESESKRCTYMQDQDKQDKSKTNSIPLLLLVKQILKNASAMTSTCIQERILEKPDNANLNLLLRFQRLLFIQLFQEVLFKTDNDVGKVSLFKKYLSLLTNHVQEIMPLAISLAKQGANECYQACQILQKDVIGLLIPELIMSLTLFHMENDQLLINENLNQLITWVHYLDQLNRLCPGYDKEDGDDMSWPKDKYKHIKDACPGQVDLPVIREADLENHNKDGGQWIVIQGQVYDIEDFRTVSDEDDITKLVEAAASQGTDDPMLQSFYVGPFGTNGDLDIPIIEKDVDDPTFSSPFMDLERNLSLFLGLFNYTLYKSLPTSDEEIQSSKWTSKQVLSGGLISDEPLNDINEEKVVEMTASHNEDLLSLMVDNAEDSRLTCFLALTEKLCRQHHLLIHMNFPPDHPVEEVGRVLLALLIKYQGLEHCMETDNNHDKLIGKIIYQ